MPRLDREEPSLMDRLMAAVAEAGIRYCCWKNNHEIDAARAGGEDLDILVEHEKFAEFVALAFAHGFIEVSAPVFRYPFVSHFYAYDPAADELLHLHVYTRLITGESHTKNFHLPFELALLDPTNLSGGLYPEPIGAWQRMIFLLRYFIKLGCLPGYILLRGKRNSLRSELTHIAAAAQSGEFDDGNDPSSVLPPGLMAQMERWFDGANPKIGTVVFALWLRWRLVGWRRFGPIRGFVARYGQIAYRAVNKVLLHRKKRPVHGGAIVAVTGSDGAGKSTVTKALSNWLGKSFDVRRAHLGRPPATPLTWPYRMALTAYRSGRSGKKSDLESSTSLQTASLVRVAHYLAIAYERAALGRRLRRWRDRGIIVICDRYLSHSVGVMDSPRIAALVGEGPILRWAARVEQRLYEAVPKADLALLLTVPLVQVVERNRNRDKADKETEEEIRQRYDEQAKLDYYAYRRQPINAGGSLALTLASAKAAVWQCMARNEPNGGLPAVGKIEAAEQERDSPAEAVQA